MLTKYKSKTKQNKEDSMFTQKEDNSLILDFEDKDIDEMCIKGIQKNDRRLLKYTETQMLVFKKSINNTNEKFPGNRY